MAANELSANRSEPQAAVPPQDGDAEQATLGSILIDPAAAAMALSLLEEGDFYPEHHQRVFRAMRQVQVRNEPVDLITVTAELRRIGLLEQAGGTEYLTALINTVPTAAHVGRYATLVAEKSVLRRLIQAGSRIQGACYDSPDDVGTVLDLAEQAIFEISQRRSSSDFEHIGALADETFTKLDRLHRHAGFVTGVPTGLIELDKLTAGLQPGDLAIVAARPSMGKTSLAVANFALHAGVQHNKGVAIFSLEMSKGQLAELLLCSHAKVNSWALRQGLTGPEEWSKIGHALKDLPAAPIFIDDTPAISILELRSKARRLRSRHPMDLIIVDYMQLVSSGTQMGGENRHQEISLIARSLKALARELHLPVVALSQLSRRVEQREDKRPILSDLAESGSIEAEADLVCFLYRQKYYERKKALQEAEKGGKQTSEGLTFNDPEETEIIISKHRNGPVGTVKVMFHPQYRLFFDQYAWQEAGE